MYNFFPRTPKLQNKKNRNKQNFRKKVGQKSVNSPIKGYKIVG